VTKPMGVVVLLQLTWSAGIGDSTRDLLVERLGIWPHHLVEWKQMLRDAGVVDIDVQDWSDGPLGRAARDSGAWRRISASKGVPPPQGPVSPSRTLPQKMHIVGRAWRRWGWRAGALGAARGALELEAQLLRDLWRERTVGFHLVSGVKWPHALPPASKGDA